jgi:hypothetical protein
MTDDEELTRLYEHLAEDRSEPTNFTSLDEDGRKAYMAVKNREYRARLRKAREQGQLKPKAAPVREALADAALMILATNGPGAEQVRLVLHAAFPAHAGTIVTIERDARKGRLKPTLVDPAAMSAARDRVAKVNAKEAARRAKSASPADGEAQPARAVVDPDDFEIPAFLRRGT